MEIGSVSLRCCVKTTAGSAGWRGKKQLTKMSNRSLTGSELAQLSAPAPRPLLHPEALALRKFSTACNQSAEWSCIDVDECWANASSPAQNEVQNSNSTTNITSSLRCVENSVCTNSWGSYTCSCLSGFFMANGSC